jgi:hypothetical protein
MIVGPGGDPQSSGSFESTPRCHYRSEGTPSVLTPFVQPHLTSPIRFSPPRDLPNDLLALAEASAFRGPQGRLELTAAAHRRYRDAHDVTASDVIREMMGMVGLATPEQDEVTVICVSNRPSNFDNVIQNYRTQTHAGKRLLFVTNSDAFDLGAVGEQVAEIGDSEIITMPESITLGECLNEAIRSCSTRFAAKFDDDDTYGPHYLGDMMIAHRYARAGVVGKHTYHARVESLGSTYRRFPGHEFVYTSFVAGGTLVIDLGATDGIEFPRRTVGEDSGFLKECRRQGIEVFSADRFNYLQHRGEANTWQMDDDDFIRKAIEVPAPLVDEDVWV